jgi:hypothetical protein
MALATNGFHCIQQTVKFKMSTSVNNIIALFDQNQNVLDYESYFWLKY